MTNTPRHESAFEVFQIWKNTVKDSILKPQIRPRMLTDHKFSML